jgi:acyl-CoA thioesterase
MRNKIKTNRRISSHQYTITTFDIHWGGQEENFTSSQQTASRLKQISKRTLLSNPIKWVERMNRKSKSTTYPASQARHNYIHAPPSKKKKDKKKNWIEASSQPKSQCRLCQCLILFAHDSTNISQGNILGHLDIWLHQVDCRFAHQVCPNIDTVDENTNNWEYEWQRI